MFNKCLLNESLQSVSDNLKNLNENEGLALSSLTPEGRTEGLKPHQALQALETRGTAPFYPQ